MAYSDPQSITIGGAANSLPRTGSSASAGEFRTADQRYKLTLAHNRAKRVQHVARVEFSDIVANPLIPTQNTAVGAAVTLTANVPLNGMSTTQVEDLVKGLVAWATPANITRLVGGEI